MERIIEYTAEKNYPSIRRFLTEKRYSGHVLSILKKDDSAVLLNGSKSPLTSAINNGDKLAVILREETGSDIEPVSMEILVVYEDDDLIIVNKPAGTEVHPTHYSGNHTLANGMVDYFQKRGEVFTYRCIERLDRNTSGLLVLAKNALSAAILTDMLKRGEIHKKYVAAVRGCPFPLQGTVDLPISQEKKGAAKRVVDTTNGKKAITHYRVLKEGGRYSLLELWLETGRTHQIRVHMSAIGCSIPGDFLYCPDYTCINRQALHAYSLDMYSPISGNRICVTAPVPDDIMEIIQ